MKAQILISITSVILLLSLLSSCSEQEKEQQLTVLSWNIWHAGHSKAYGQKACDGIIGVLKKSQADVILMVETYGAAPMIADSLGYEHYLISSNLCIFSRYPIVKNILIPM